MLERKNHWSCDYCKSEQVLVGHCLPSGWVWIKSIEGISHACESCKKAIDKSKWGQSGEEK